MAKRKRGEKFTGSTGANGGVVLERDNFLKEGDVATGEPAEPEAGEAISLTDGTKTDGTVVKLTGGWQSRGWVVLEFAIDLVGKNVNIVLRGKIEDTAKDVRQ